MMRIMGYYSPKWMAVIGMLLAFINSVASPLFGFLFAKILFVMMNPVLDTSERDFWCGMFLLLAGCVLVISLL